ECRPRDIGIGRAIYSDALPAVTATAAQICAVAIAQRAAAPCQFRNEGLGIAGGMRTAHDTAGGLEVGGCAIARNVGSARTIDRNAIPFLAPAPTQVGAIHQ